MKPAVVLTPGIRKWCQGCKSAETHFRSLNKEESEISGCMLLGDKDLHWWILCPCSLTNSLRRLWLTGALFMPALCGTDLPGWSSVVCWQVPSPGGESGMQQLVFLIMWVTPVAPPTPLLP